MTACANGRNVLYGALQPVYRRTFRRAEWRELQFQTRMRRAPVRDVQDYSMREAVRYAREMATVSPAYGELLTERGIAASINADDWRRLPTLRKTDYQQEPERWFNPQVPPERQRWSCTSGSTGEPYRFPQDDTTLTAEHISFELSLRALGWTPGMREAIFKMELPPPKLATRAVRRIMGNTPISFSAVKFRAEHTADVIGTLRERRIDYLRGYSSAVALLAEESQRLGLRCRIPLVTTFGEGLSAAQQQVIEDVFDAQAYRDYGGSEAMHVGFECPARTGYHLDLTRFHVEVLDGERPVRPGETGEIVVTCFRNRAMPFVRYRMGDLGTLADPAEPCPCGNTLPRLTAVQGRINDTIFTPSGRFVNVLFFVYVLEFAHEHIGGFRIVQRATDWLEILWVPRHSAAAACLPDLEKQIIERTDGTMKITWQAVTEIPPDSSGKRKLLVPLQRGA